MSRCSRSARDAASKLDKQGTVLLVTGTHLRCGTADPTLRLPFWWLDPLVETPLMGDDIALLTELDR